ncbi:hypothetical protein HMPREF9554_02076 [Treponema phagedenis F0421]|nr:hypothetical protein HMPREF9554_02076 [Treponema phagedenis F0421]
MCKNCRIVISEAFTLAQYFFNKLTVSFNAFYKKEFDTTV